MTDYKNELELSEFMKQYAQMDEYSGADLIWTGEYNIPNGVEFLAKLEALLSKRELEAEVRGARKYVSWGYGGPCETKDIDDWPDIKNDPLANRCPTCREWERLEEWETRLTNREEK